MSTANSNRRGKHPPSILATLHREFISLGRKDGDSDNDSISETKKPMSTAQYSEDADDGIEVSFQRGKTNLLQVLLGAKSCAPIIPTTPIFSFPFPIPSPPATFGPASHVHLVRLSTDLPIRVPIYTDDGDTAQNHKNNRYNRMILDNRLNTPSVSGKDPQKIQNAMLLLERHIPLDEQAAVAMEIQKCTWEIENIRKHMNLLRGGSNTHDRGFISTSTWDIQELLVDYSTRKRFTLFHTYFTPTAMQRKYLQRRRGVICHATFEGDETRRKFHAATTNGKSTNVHKTFTQLPHSLIRMAASVPDVRHMGLSVHPGKSTSFFLIKDDGSSFYDPKHLPPQLLDKLNKIQQAQIVQYMATGPQGSYYIELASGECWWGIGGNDTEFNKVMNLVDVYRVAFGPFVVDKMGGQMRVETSWIVVAKDGRVLFRNIPRRLQILLQQRPSHMPSIAEVSLGAAGSYFVRFLDNTIDYLLPSFVADACKTVIKQGSSISSLSLHAEAPNDFIIRHSRFHKK